MDDRVFGRRYSLIIGRFDQLIPKIKENLFDNLAIRLASGIPSGIATVDSGYLDFNTIPASFIEITDLQMTAKIVSNKENTSPATLQVYNLHPRDVANIKQDDLVILKAGYKQDVTKIQTSVGEGFEQDLPVLFVGQVVRVTTTRDNNDIVTEIICGDSITVKKNVKVTASWPPGTTRLKVIQDLVKIAAGNGIPTGNIQTFNLQPDGKTLGVLNSPYIGGYSLQGYLFEELEKLCDSCGMRAYTVCGKLFVEPKVVTRTIETIVISPFYIKGNINVEADNSKSLSGENSSNKVGLTLNLYLNGRVQPNQVLVLVDSGEYNGEYSIDSITHNLNYRERTWDTVVSCVKI